MHVRTQLRQAAVAALQGLATTGERVRADRVYAEHELPALTVRTPNDTVAQATQGWPARQAQERDIELTIEARAKAPSDTIGAVLDQIALEVEAAIAAEPTFGGLAQVTQLGATATEVGDEVEQPAGVATLTYMVRIRVDGTDPGTRID